MLIWGSWFQAISFGQEDIPTYEKLKKNEMIKK
jgi:hypothetical protein